VLLDGAILEQGGIEKAFFDPAGVEQKNLTNAHGSRLGQDAPQHDRPGQGKNEVSGRRGGRLLLPVGLDHYFLRRDGENAASAQGAINHPDSHHVARLAAEYSVEMTATSIAMENRDLVLLHLFRLDEDEVHARRQPGEWMYIYD
jgi:hypothetical protein